MHLQQIALFGNQLGITKKMLEEEEDAPRFIVRLACQLPRFIQNPSHHHISIKGIEVVNLGINNNGVTKMLFLGQGSYKIRMCLENLYLLVFDARKVSILQYSSIFFLLNLVPTIEAYR